ncbi:hypothetical protein KP806_01535 [Paenibacillus sp. N4]|nr:hypothetical protein [Paenibacillus vietnamensis]MCA0753716.1 hypothetical protein [Paenibacillus vietnamensis]
MVKGPASAEGWRESWVQDINRIFEKAIHPERNRSPQPKTAGVTEVTP